MMTFMVLCLRAEETVVDGMSRVELVEDWVGVGGGLVRVYNNLVKLGHLLSIDTTGSGEGVRVRVRVRVTGVQV
jgi:hypothetical protein